MRAEVIERIGPDLAAATDVELLVWGEPVEAPPRESCTRLLAATIREHDPEASRCR